MEFKIYEYNDNGITLAAYIDTYISAIWTERYFDCGEFELKLTATDDIVNLIHRDMLVERADVESQMICIIEKIEMSDDSETGTTITIKGRCASALTARRVMIIQFDSNMVMYGVRWTKARIKTILQDIITRFCTNPTKGYHETPYYHINDLKNRKMPYFKCDDSDMMTQCDVNIEMQEKGAVVLDKITELCANNGIGIRAVKINGDIHLQFYDGVDRSTTQTKNPSIIFSKDFDNIKSQKLAVDQTSKANVVYIGGCGEGEKRVFEFTELEAVLHPDETPPKVGINRFEKYADRRDIGIMNEDGKPEINGDTANYRAALLAEAELSLRDVEIVSESEIVSTSQFAYREDFSVGDFVTIIGKYATEKTRVVEVIETDDASNGYVISISTSQNDVALSRSAGSSSGGVIGGSNGNQSGSVRTATYTDAGVVIVDEETMTVDSTGKISVKPSQSTVHPDIATSNPTSATTPTKIDAGGNFAAITNIIRDNNGHVKTFEVKLYQLPSNDVKAVFTGASNGTSAGTDLPNGQVYFNLILNGKAVSGHKISGANGAEVTTDKNGDVVITAKSSNTGTLTHSEQNMTIDTGFAETPKIFVLYCNFNGEIVQAAKCRPGLAAPFDCVLNADLPIVGVDFNGSAVTVNCHTSTGLTFAWEAYI